MSPVSTQAPPSRPSSADGPPRWRRGTRQLPDVPVGTLRRARRGAPGPSGSEREYNDYVFERAVRHAAAIRRTAPKRIDLYKNAFVLVAKQSRLADEPAVLGKRNIARGWDVMMKNARQQAETTSSCSTPTIPRRPSSSCAMSATASSSSRLHGHRPRLWPFPGPQWLPRLSRGSAREKTRALLKTIWQAHERLGYFVMYWWDRSAEFLTTKSSSLPRFGFVTTNSITQEFSRRVMKKRMEGEDTGVARHGDPGSPLDEGGGGCGGRADSYGRRYEGEHEGVLRKVVHERGLDTDDPIVEVRGPSSGRINPDLQLGWMSTSASLFSANEGLCSPGSETTRRRLHSDAGRGATSRSRKRRELKTAHPSLSQRAGFDGNSRGVMVIDLFGFESEEVRKYFPRKINICSIPVNRRRDNNNPRQI